MKKHNKTDFSSNIARVLDEEYEDRRDRDYKYTKEQFAKDLGIDHTLLNKYMSGDRQPTLENISKIIDGLNCSVDYLLGLSPVPKREWNDTDKSIETISRLTGLSSESLNLLILSYSEKTLGNKNKTKVMNELILNPMSENLYEILYDYFFKCSPEGSIRIENAEMDINQYFGFAIATQIQNMKKYSDSSIEYYKKWIEACQEENKKIKDKSSDDYQYNSWRIRTWAQLIEDRKQLTQLTKAANSMSLEELNQNDFVNHEEDGHIVIERKENSNGKK